MKEIIEVNWIVVDEDGLEHLINTDIPHRDIDNKKWKITDIRNHVDLPSGSIEKLIGRKLSWKDDPVKIVGNADSIIRSIDLCFKCNNYFTDYPLIPRIGICARSCCIVRGDIHEVDYPLVSCSNFIEKV